MSSRTANPKIRASYGLLAAALVSAAAAMPALGQSVTVTGNAPFPASRIYQGNQETLTLTVNSTVVLGQIQVPQGYNDFSVSQNTCSQGYTPPDVTCTIQINFSPQLPGWNSSPAPISRWAPLQIQYYDTASQTTVFLNIPLTGTGQYPQGVLSPGVITDLIGNDVTRPGGFGGDGSAAANAVFMTPAGIAMDVQGNIYIADTGNGVIRMYYQAGSFPWIAGGAALVAGDVYTIAGVVPVGGVSHAGPGVDGVVATSSPLNGPTGVALDASGNLYIADNNNQAVRVVAGRTGIITTVAGTLNSPETPGTGFSGDLGPATAAQLYIPDSVSVDGYGNIYIADSGNNAVRVVYEGGTALAALIALEIPGTTATVGDIYTIAGGPANGALPGNGDGGLASAADLNFPQGVTVDSQGDVYIADSTNQAVRRVDVVSGNISSVYKGGDTPVNLAVDSSDSIYFTLQAGCSVMQYNPSLQQNLTTPATTSVAGNGTCMPSGDGGASNAAGLAGAQGVVVDGAGNLYLLEADGVRMVATTNTPFNFGAVNVGTVSAPATVVLTDDDILPYNGINYYGLGEVFSLSQGGSPFNYTPYVGANPNVTDCDASHFGGYNSSLSPGFACGASFVFSPINDGGPFTNYAYTQTGPGIALSGTGTGPLPTATLTGGPLSFTAVVNETTSAAQTLVLTNTSAINLALSQIYFSTYSGFQETDTCGISTYAANPTLVPGASCNINVTFATSTLGAASATIYVVDNASSGGGIQTAALSGTGLAPLGVLSPATLTFPVTTPGNVVSLPLTLTNEGTATLHINPTGFSIAGNDPGRFAITNNGCGATLAINASCGLTVSFTPLTYAYYTASLDIQDDTGGVHIYNSTTTPTYLWNTQTLGLIGPTGNPPIETNITIGNAAFPAIAVGSSETQTVTLALKNAVEIESIAMTTGFTEYTIGAITGCVVDGVTVNAAGTVCNVPVTFTPAAPGIRDAPLAAIDNEVDGAVPYAFALSGTGNGPVASLTPGIITTVVGGSHGTAEGIVGADGPATGAAVGFTPGMAIDTAGEIFLADNENEVIWKTDTSGNIHMYAGSPFTYGGYAESLAGDGGVAIGAHLGFVGVIALDSKDGLYLAETDSLEENPRIRYIDPATGLITTAIGFVPPGSWAAATAFFYSTRIVVTVSGTKYLFVAAAGGTSGSTQPAWPTSTGATIKDGTVTWQNQGVYFGGAGCTAQTDSFGDGCVATQAAVYGVSGIAVDPSGNVFFADESGSLIRRVDATTKIVSLVAGTGTPGYAGDGGPATSAKIAASDLAFDTNGNLVFIDNSGYMVRKVTMSTGVISTLAGKAVSTAQQDYCYGGGGYGGLAVNAYFAAATSLAIDAANDIYIADNSGCVVSRIDSGTNIIHVVAGIPNSQAFYENPGYGDVGFGPYVSDGDASAAILNQPNIIRLDGTANVYIASSYGGVRKVDVSRSVLNFTGSSYTQNGTPTQLDTVSGPQTTMVLNAGNNASLNFTTPFLALPLWGISNQDYIRDTTSPTGVADCYSVTGVGVGYECPVSVDFAPLSGSGYILATDTVNDNAVPGLVAGTGSQPIHLIGLTGGPAPLVTLTPFLLSFSTPQGAYSPLQTLTLTNNDVNPLPISSITITGTGASAFSQTNNCGTSLPAGAYCLINVMFSPPVVGGGSTNLPPPDVLNAVVTVMDTAANAPQVSQLTGTGTLPAAGTASILMPDNETIHITDTLSLSPSTILNFTDTITISDNLPAVVPSTILNFADTITVSDNMPAVVPSLIMNFTDTITVTDSVPLNGAGAVFIPISEVIHTTDALAFPMAVFISDIETIHTTDSIQLPVFINDAETIHTTDGLTADVSSYADTTTLTAAATVVTSGSPFQLTATVKGISTTTVPTGTVGFYDGSSLLGSVAVTGGAASYTTAALGVGTHLLVAKYLGDSNFPATTSATLQTTVTTQTVLNVTPMSTSRNFGISNPTFTYGITGFTGGDTMAVVSGSPVLSTTATLNSLAGSYPITAAQGTLSAPSKYAFNFSSGTLTVNGNAAQTITFLPIPNVPYSSVGYMTLTAHSTSGLAITYTVTGPATLSGSRLSLTGTGAVKLTAAQAGSSTFAPATSVARTFTVTP